VNQVSDRSEFGLAHLRFARMVRQTPADKVRAPRAPRTARFRSIAPRHLPRIVVSTILNDLMAWLRTAKHRPQHPDDVRMSFGEHLEELRTRIIRLLVGAVIGMIVCFVFSDRLMTWMLKPLDLALAYNRLPRQIVVIDPIENFMVVMKVSIYCGLIITAPWCLYQLWAFVAAGLYEHEKYWVKKFFPISVALFFTGVLFCFTVILPIAFAFLLSIRSWIPAPNAEDNFITRLVLGKINTPHPTTTQPAGSVPISLPMLDRDPPKPADGQVWVNTTQRRLKVGLDGQILAAALAPQEGESFVMPQLTLDQTVTFITHLAMGFGMGFQVPVVVVLLAMLRIVSPDVMAGARRYVILGIVVASAIITPTPDITSQLLLAVPMWMLFEGGLVVARRIIRNRKDSSFLVEGD